jgi:hypothetical protein
VVARVDSEQLDIGGRAVLETRLDDHAVVDADDIVLRLHQRFAHQHGARLVVVRQAGPVRQRLAEELECGPRRALGRVVLVRVGEEVRQQLAHGSRRLGDACRPERRRQVSESQPRSPAEVLHDRLGSGGDGCERVLLSLDLILAMLAFCGIDVFEVLFVGHLHGFCVRSIVVREAVGSGPGGGDAGPDSVAGDVHLRICSRTGIYDTAGHHTRVRS